MSDESTQNFINLPSCNDAPEDLLTKKTSQLHALLTTTIGGGFESFDNWNGAIKESFLWVCAELAGDISELSQLVTSKPK